MRKEKNLRESEVEKHVSVVTQQMKQLHSDLFDLIPILEKLDEEQKEKLTNNLSLLTAVLMKSLLSVTT
ncbi:hypothetical protein [Bacillus sp. ISL-18]|uniref:hypothetical protein n=1 Tax=Bacillus sp. ISL-18 TaxID=2819118 RepID=UPI0027DFB038|nr:hypothetical protein [Bacillus sp. ISL-18]